MKRVLWGLQFFGVVVLSLPLSFLPCRVGEFLGLLLHYLWKIRRAIAVENLKRSISLNALSITGSPEDIIRDSFKNLGRSFIEIIKVYYGRGRRILDRIAIKGMENLESAKARGKGVLFITGHCGNWELLAIASSVKVTPLSVVARPLNNPYLNRFLERARSRFGNRVIYKRGALRGIVSTLRDGGSVGILMDQAVVPDEGYVIEFLGRGAWTTKMPALIARKTDTPVLPVFIRRTGDGHEITIYPEVGLSSNATREATLMEDTKRFSDFIVDYIRENPSEWLWLHRRWKRVP
ncbi:MAG: lysophospholipid acyltransferase family protein [Thermodesulfovibrionales bacterium]